MDSSEQHDERELEVIREEMERKRADLADKLGALESQVLGTVQTATEAVGDVKEAVATVKETVSDTVSSVKETVSDTVQTVAETFNVSRHVQNYPWAAMGCAVATGFAGGLLLGGSRRDEASQEADEVRMRATAPPTAMAAPPPAPPSHPPAQEEEGPGIGEQLLGSLGDAWGRLTGGLQGLAVGSVMGLVRQMAQSSLPDGVKADVCRFLDDVNDKLGGKATELSQSVVNYVSDAISSHREEDQPADAVPPPSPGAQPVAPSTSARQQQRNGPRHRAGSR